MLKEELIRLTEAIQIKNRRLIDYKLQEQRIQSHH